MRGQLALIGSFELLMLLIRKHHQADTGSEADDLPRDVVLDQAQIEPHVAQPTPTLEETVRDLHAAGHSQRSIARGFNIDRRKVKQIVDPKPRDH